MLRTPVLFLVFNRPDVTQRVFDAIRLAKPERLYIAADGPRQGKEGEVEMCRQTRAIAEQVDWNCEVKKLFRENNLGCKIAVSSAIDWFFENEEEGIILEDDCLPDQSFFPFCEELLAYYRDNEKVMHISGDNFQFGRKRGTGSYYFSQLNHIWGWATWKRAWQFYDVKMVAYKEFLAKNQIAEIHDDKGIQDYWLKYMDLVYTGKRDTWDLQWTFAIWRQHGLSVLPNENLVSNIGFTTDATHTKIKVSKLADIPAKSMGKIVHPSQMAIDVEADEFTYRQFNPTYINKAKNILLNYLR